MEKGPLSWVYLTKSSIRGPTLASLAAAFADLPLARRGKQPCQPLELAGIQGVEKLSSPSTSLPTSSTFLPYRPLSVNLVKGHESKNTFTVWDGKTGTAYLADTGADISVHPVSLEDCRKVPQTPLATANGTGIKS